jgi:hypothetical protein
MKMNFFNDPNVFKKVQSGEVHLGYVYSGLRDYLDGYPTWNERWKNEHYRVSIEFGENSDVYPFGPHDIVRALQAASVYITHAVNISDAPMTLAEAAREVQNMGIEHLTAYVRHRLGIKIPTRAKRLILAWQEVATKHASDSYLDVAACLSSISIFVLVMRFAAAPVRANFLTLRGNIVETFEHKASELEPQPLSSAEVDAAMREAKGYGLGPWWFEEDDRAPSCSGQH